jgi:pimeloyl-ACP methyl ester carboxylesterase
MQSLKSEFKFKNRGFEQTLVLVPGWATDYRIFDSLGLGYNYLLTTRVYPFDFNQALLGQLDELKLGKVSLFGFSLGGFLAAEFAASFPEKINELILLGVRKGYEPKNLEDIKSAIRKNRKAWLYKFYLNCFSRGDTQGLAWFKQNLLKEYTRNLSLDELVWGLDYLARHTFRPESLRGIEKIRIFQGSQDKIVPLEEALQIKSGLPEARFILLSDLGHLSFLNPSFKKIFYDQKQ